MTDRLVLHASAALVELVVREFHDVERIRDLDGVGEHRVEHRPIRTRQIKRRPFDVRPPLLRTRSKPAARLDARAACNNIEELPGTHIDDRRRPVLLMELAESHEQRLVQAERRGFTDAVGVVIDERFAVRDHRVVDRVPRTLELAGELVHRAAMGTDLAGHPPARTIGHSGARRRDPAIVTGPGPNGT